MYQLTFNKIVSDWLKEDSGIKLIRRYSSLKSLNNFIESLKVLIVTSSTFDGGIQPVCFGSFPDLGIHVPFTIVEITPKEFEDIQKGNLKLPNDWNLIEESIER